MKEAVRKVYLIAHKRLLAAMYTCNIQTTSEVLGKLYGVIAKRNGKILEDDMIEGTFSKKNQKNSQKKNQFFFNF